MDLPNYGETYIVLNGRYALMECLAESASGSIYRGRDLDKIRENGLLSRVLIHVLPSGLALSAQQVFQQIQQACVGLSATAGVLPACAYGNDGATAYIVLASPACTGTQSLSQETHLRAASWRIAAQRLAPLIKRRALPKQVDPALLLSTPEQQVYVLATAFSPTLQALTRIQQRGVVVAGRYYLRRLSVGLSLVALMVFGAVTAHALMKQTSATHGEALKPVAHTLPPASVPMGEVQALHAARITVQPQSASVVSVPKLIPVQSSVEQRAKSQPAPVVGAVKVTDKASPSKIHSSKTSANSAKPASFPRAQTVRLATEVTVQPAAVKARPVALVEATLPEPAPLVEQPPVVDNTAAQLDSTIQQAYRALQAGRLSDAPQGALRFTRELRGLAPQHPQVARLGQEITAAYLRHIRAALQVRDLDQVARLLPVTRQLIAEFQLKNLEAAQQVLENKLVELGG